MNILVFSWRDPKHPKAGGAEQVMHEHMKGWIEVGHEVTLFSSKTKNLARTEEIDGVKIIRRGHEYLGVQVAAFGFYLKNRKTYDFLVDQFHGIPFFTPLYSNKPKLAILQEVAREVWLLNPLPWPLNKIIGRLAYWLEPLIFLFYKNTPFMVGSRSAEDDLTKMGIPGKNITIVPHGVIIKDPAKNIKKLKTKTVVFLGALTKDKGIEDALECFSILNKQDKYNFWVIGKPESEDYLKYLKNKSKKLGISKNTKFWGFVSQERKFKLLKKAHVLINPSIREGWGLVNIEANAMGMPVVAYRSAGLVDSVSKQSGILVSRNTPKELAKEVGTLFDKSSRLKKLSHSAIKWSSQFSWTKSRQKSLRLLENIYAKKH